MPPTTTARRWPTAANCSPVSRRAANGCARNGRPPRSALRAGASATASIISRPPRRAPVLVFIHGGYWQMRAKETFRSLPRARLRTASTSRSIGYTLAPGADARRHRCRSARGHRVARRARAGYGGDPARIYVSGWSAGGHLTAMCLGEPAVQRRAGDQRHLRSGADPPVLSQRQAGAGCRRRRSD